MSVSSTDSVHSTGTEYDVKYPYPYSKGTTNNLWEVLGSRSVCIVCQSQRDNLLDYHFDNLLWLTDECSVICPDCEHNTLIAVQVPSRSTHQIITSATVSHWFDLLVDLSFQDNTDLPPGESKVHYRSDTGAHVIARYTRKAYSSLEYVENIYRTVYDTFLRQRKEFHEYLRSIDASIEAYHQARNILDKSDPDARHKLITAQLILKIGIRTSSLYLNDGNKYRRVAEIDNSSSPVVRGYSVQDILRYSLIRSLEEWSDYTHAFEEYHICTQGEIGFEELCDSHISRHKRWTAYLHKSTVLDKALWRNMQDVTCYRCLPRDVTYPGDDDWVHWRDYGRECPDFYCPDLYGQFT